ncbi:hypothetical protein GUITHDRAFT_114894 [Guillardia theta CCMP2712]|uniref:Guanylyl cyclase n=1 Tax=Guillardia theta (strain CCMP2712) TaxID=905079 RepID=L1IRW6_GUITC|nr:hypothetical protein GUITHDRAFT_114894 [Guillardia theta CCMP2712]EKX39016.1 hypothetical protein GUITHDRAFT_114894 [Guillardia theta CCMP2712]|eukprot:XP_005825996.1 hypothetical protein GUITHDRAFT_114894 [Guillardia theta CCMP2712]
MEHVTAIDKDQRYDWDCGLVCCQMCLKWVNRPQSFSALTRRCPTKSTWSIDLAFLLHGFGVKARYYTITWGANQSYTEIEYYKENLQSDASRVNDLFNNAAARGLHVELKSLVIDQIIEALVKDTCVIMILGCADASAMLKGKQSETGEEAGQGTERMPHSLPSVGIDTGFVGHYVILIAYHTEKQMFEIADPGVEAERRLIQKDALEHARKQHGTDEDLLVIDVENLMQDCNELNTSAPEEREEIFLRCKRKG